MHVCYVNLVEYVDLESLIVLVKPVVHRSKPVRQVRQLARMPALQATYTANALQGSYV